MQGDRCSSAEADGNRTRLTEVLGHHGVEDRARHQTRYASTDHSKSPREPPASQFPQIRAPWAWFNGTVHGDRHGTIA